MSTTRTAMVGMLGFMIGAGAMMMPGNQKMKRQVQKQADRIARFAKMW